ncbi:MAG: hypothetical protein U0670_05610 [Anaerolineae bacterium]
MKQDIVQWKRWPVRMFILLWSASIAACTGIPTINPTASQRVNLGDILSDVAFDQPYEWEFYRDSSRGILFGIEEGAYRARIPEGGFAWAMNGTPHTDVAIQADILPYSTETDNGFGLACRASAQGDGDGYYFLISSDGAFTIRRGVNNVIEPLIAWTRNPSIHEGLSPNRMRIVCVGGYLALYVNGEFVGETHDDRYQEGFAGIAAAVPEGKAVDVAFDNLTIWAASTAPVTP